jgi:hypothetical protein
MLRRRCCILGAIALAFACREAHAEMVAPPATRGFQLALRTGAAVPIGNVSSTTAMSDALSIQVPLIVDIGGRPIPRLFVGAYLGTALGGAAGKLAATCQQLAVNCIGVGFRGGVLVEYSLHPEAAINPWFGYAFAYEIGLSSGSNGTNSISNTVRGFEYAHLLAGADFRLQEYFGIGPFLDVSLGSYDVAQSETNVGGLITKLGDISGQALHAWLIFGVRAVLFP